MLFATVVAAALFLGVEKPLSLSTKATRPRATHAAMVPETAEQLMANRAGR
jgi:hypothetical protein